MADKVTSGTFEGVDVYRNLLRHTVSIRSHGKVVAWSNDVTVTNVTFRVQPAGIARIRRQGQREVIAFARGTAQAHPGPVAIPAEAVRVYFNPFEHAAFVLADGTPVVSADLLIVATPHGSWVVNPR